jgi:hypothetical protein
VCTNLEAYIHVRMQNVKTHPLPTNSDLPAASQRDPQLGTPNTSHRLPSCRLLIQLIIPPPQTSHHNLADRSFHTHPESPPGLAPRRPHLTARCKRPSPAVSTLYPRHWARAAGRPGLPRVRRVWRLDGLIAIPFQSILPSRWSEWSYCLLGCLERPGRGGIRDVRRFHHVGVEGFGLQAWRE